MKVHKPGKPSYHYYVSTAVTTGRRDKAGAVTRISAPLIEEIVAKRLGQLRVIETMSITPDWTTVRDVIDRVEIGSETVTILLDEERLAIAARDLSPEHRVAVERLGRRGDQPMTEISVRLVRRGGTMVGRTKWVAGRIVHEDRSTPHHGSGPRRSLETSSTRWRGGEFESDRRR